MRGTVLGYDSQDHTGAISGYDGNRYGFTRAGWKASGEPRVGVLVDFDVNGQKAVGIYTVGAQANGGNGAQGGGLANFLFSPRGRIRRKPLWGFLGVNILIELFVGGIGIAIDQSAGNDQLQATNALLSLYSLIVFYPGIAVSIKRCHDRGRSGWFLLISLIPLVGAIWLFVELYCLAGVPGDNAYGPEPA